MDQEAWSVLFPRPQAMELFLLPHSEQCYVIGITNQCVIADWSLLDCSVSVTLIIKGQSWVAQSVQ